MPRRFFIFDDPDRFVTGTVGSPGRRTFFLQAIQGQRIASVALEKVQVALLADRISLILAELERRGVEGVATAIPRGDDDRSLDEPLREEFRVGTITISWDGEESDLLLEARSLGDADDDDDDEDEDDVDDEALAAAVLEAVAEEAIGEDEDDEDEVPDDAPVGPDVLRVRLSPALALGFTRRARRVIAAGRPPCPRCGEPLDPQGHLCARRGTLLN